MSVTRFFADANEWESAKKSLKEESYVSVSFEGEPTYFPAHVVFDIDEFEELEILTVF